MKFANSKHFDSIVPDYLQYQDPTFDVWKEEVNDLLSQYIKLFDVVKLRAALSTVMQISQRGNNFLQSNGLNNKLAENEPSKCAAVVGVALDLIHLLASVIAPYMPDTAKLIDTQLDIEASPIPDHWTADSIQPGHRIGRAAFLFSPIKVEKEQKWRNMFGSKEAKEAKEAEARLKAAKQAAKALKREHLGAPPPNPSRPRYPT